MNVGVAHQRIERDLVLEAGHAGRRLDQVLAELLPEFSRSRLQQWIESGELVVDDQRRRPRDKVWGGERIRLAATLALDERCVAQPIALDIVHEDDALLVVNKPAGLVVHPAAGNPDGTLQNALLHHEPGLAALPRAGIVHRLDKDTSGLLVVAKTLAAHRSLVEQLRLREVHREYRALVIGECVAGGRVEAPVGRHPTQRTRMAVVAGGRPAVSHYRVLERFPGHTLLAVELETGRTHQIRVHMSHLRHPLVGDRLYGGRPRPPRGCSVALREALQRFPRQALHAIRLGLRHPEDGRELHWEVAMAADLEALLAQLREEGGDDADPA
ncbi:23S rRNA pseudouridine(1911/1915/1917) synthase RluD [Marichromatium gracile]|uniref:Pseudouridine synthase n=1 Tax=Marichromatium gracile TaxID=1048 RepID=A0ABR5VF12_MARGR|nr:23S rRNA pseudouridine(1911/1915/1917) synthase RluD [Marichromatium gracile]KXX63955.1 RNA pseudouridine synthase [Marichromatium gracile]